MRVNYELIGRINYALNPQDGLMLQDKYTPSLKDLKHIPEIYAVICNTYPDLEQYDKNVLITACIYSLYCPASLIAAKVQNAPTNMRRAIADLLEYENATNINYWHDIARAFIKNPRYVQKIERIAEHFKNI